MSTPIDIIKDKSSTPEFTREFRPERSLSENFESRSENSKSVILGFTDGVKPTSQVLYREAVNRIRVDSCSLSPVSKALLQYYGLTTIDKNEF